MGALPSMTIGPVYDEDESLCNRCGRTAREYGCVTVHRDTDLQEKETSYYDLCPRCMKYLDRFLTYQEDAR